jgi:DNA invertase Pin-like site-specific DNA recombinase
MRKNNIALHMKKAAVYLRCSTDKQDQSIPDQKKAILEYTKFK